jgi:hypothetical protein
MISNAAEGKGDLMLLKLDGEYFVLYAEKIDVSHAFKIFYDKCIRNPGPSFGY